MPILFSLSGWARIAIWAFRTGRVEPTNFDGYSSMRIAEMPKALDCFAALAMTRPFCCW